MIETNLPMSDDDFLQRIINGDKALLEKVYLDNKEACLNFAKKRLFRQSKNGAIEYCNEDDALERYQDAFAKMIFNIEQGRLTKLDAKFSTYIFAIMRNKWVKDHRNPPPSDYPWDDDPEDTDIKESVNKILMRMDPSCRKMLTTRYYFGWKDYDDIANELGYENGATVRNLISRCRKKFRNIYKELF